MIASFRLLFPAVACFIVFFVDVMVSYTDVISIFLWFLSANEASGFLLQMKDRGVDTTCPCSRLHAGPIGHVKRRRRNDSANLKLIHEHVIKTKTKFLVVSFS